MKNIEITWQFAKSIERLREDKGRFKPNWNTVRVSEIPMDWQHTELPSWNARPLPKPRLGWYTHSLHPYTSFLSLRFPSWYTSNTVYTGQSIFHWTSILQPDDGECFISNLLNYSLIESCVIFSHFFLSKGIFHLIIESINQHLLWAYSHNFNFIAPFLVKLYCVQGI